MSAVRNRVLREIFLAPSVVLPIVAGVSAWLVSWAGDGVTALTMAGLVGVLGGLGWMATRAIFQTEKITLETIAKLQEKAIRAEQEELDSLDQLLSTDRDDRDQELLRQLRSQRAQFEELAGQPEIVVRSQEILSGAKQLFRASVHNLSESYRLLDQARKMAAGQRSDLLAEREQLLQEIQKSADHLESTLTQYKGLTKKSTGGELSQLRDDLDASLRIAKRTEERLRELDPSPQLRSYLKE